MTTSAGRSTWSTWRVTAGPSCTGSTCRERYIISVTDSAGRPVPDAVVAVSADGQLLQEGRTYADGRTLFFPGALPVPDAVSFFDVSVEKDGVIQTLEFPREEESEWQVTLNGESGHQAGVPLDVLFLLDSTGSMADEIDQIKSTLLSIAARVSDLPSQPDLRFGMVSYRDRGDDYVTRLFDFDSNVGRFSGTIRGVEAEDGGDEPESLNEALHVAIQRPEWRTGDAIRLVFLLADAPPHLDYQDDYDYAVEMVEARKRGIKVFLGGVQRPERAGGVHLPADSAAHHGPLYLPALSRLRRRPGHHPQRA